MTNRAVSLITQGPANWSEPLAKHYKEDEQDYDKYVGQVAQQGKEWLVAQEKTSLPKTITKFASLSAAARKLKYTMDKQAELDKAADKEATETLFGNLHRKKGDRKIEEEVWEEISTYQAKKVDVMANDRKIYKEIINKRFPGDEHKAIRDAYLKVNGTTLVYARETQAIRAAGLLTKEAFEAQAIHGTGRSEEAANWSDETFDDEYRTWQLKQLAIYSNSEGLLGSTVLKELDRQASTRSGLKRASTNSQIVSDKALAFKENLSTYVSAEGNENNAAKFVQNEILTRKIDFEDIVRPDGSIYTATQQARDEVLPLLSELAYAGKLDVPALLSGKVDKGGVEMPLAEAFFTEGKKTSETYNEAGSQLIAAHRAGGMNRLNQAMAQNGQKLQQSLINANDGKLTQDQIDLAAQEWLNNGGSKDDKRYKALIGYKVGSNDEVVKKKDSDKVDAAILTGKVGVIENAVNSATNTEVTVNGNKHLDKLKKFRQDQKVGDKNSDASATNKMNTRNDLNLAPGGKVRDGSPTIAHSYISKISDEVIANNFQKAEAEGTLHDTKWKTIIDAEITSRLKGLGFYAEEGDPDVGILTPDSEGKYPALEAFINKDLEMGEGSSNEISLQELRTSLKTYYAKKDGKKSKQDFLQQKGSVLNNTELVAFADASDTAERTKKPIVWPKDILLKAEATGVPPSELVKFQLKALISSNNQADKLVVQAYGLDKLDLKKIPSSDIKVRQFLEEHKDDHPYASDILAQYNKLGITSFTSNQIERLLTIEKNFSNLGEARELTQLEKDKIREKNWPTLGEDFGEKINVPDIELNELDPNPFNPNPM